MQRCLQSQCACTAFRTMGPQKRKSMYCSELPARVYESLKVLCCLAAAKRPLQAHDIAAATHLPPAQAPKILQQMRWAGFVDSRRGPTGGFWLARPPQKIRVFDVFSFFAPPRNSMQEPDPILQSLARATARCEKKVARITVANLARHSPCKALRQQPSSKHMNRKGIRMRKRTQEVAVEGPDYQI